MGKRLLTDGYRTYPICIAFDADSEWKIIHKVSGMIFNLDEWLCVPEPWGEALQLRLFIMASRVVSLVYILCVCIQRWFPYLTYDSLRREASANLLRTLPECTLDPYAVNLRRFYGILFASSSTLKEEVVCRARNVHL